MYANFFVRFFSFWLKIFMSFQGWILLFFHQNHAYVLYFPLYFHKFWFFECKLQWKCNFEAIPFTYKRTEVKIFINKKVRWGATLYFPPQSRSLHDLSIYHDIYNKYSNIISTMLSCTAGGAKNNHYFDNFQEYLRFELWDGGGPPSRKHK